jgi:hypothetical protein
MAEYAMIQMAAALKAAAERLGLNGPLTVRLTAEDGDVLSQYAAHVAGFRGAEPVRRAEIAGVSFEWPAQAVLASAGGREPIR